MGKLNVVVLRYLSRDDFRVLTADIMVDSIKCSTEILQMAEHMRRRRTDSEGTMGSMGSCSTIPLEVVRQKVRRQLSKQQKAAQRRRLQKGEANLVTSVRRENDSNIKCSMESDSFWG